MSEYDLRFFKEIGFKRRKCKVCGTPFWSKEKEVCGDAPCQDYEFFEVPVKRRLSFREAREAFLNFFKRRGHEILPPRPVVARWREDLYLTIASIVVFQPHVTKGIVPPPANPLVISQPCIRLEDIDSVGITLGRHMTGFEMGGHHAFNYPDKRVYWKEETVKLAYEFFTEEIGVPEEYITFKESWWEGGGNAGPSFEVAIEGLEVATLVFMQYEVVGEKQYRPMNMKIVDTGYGIERIAWLTQKTPTAFHAVYGELLMRFHKELGVEEPPREMLYSLARAAGRIDPDDPKTLEVAYKEASERTGLKVGEIEELHNRVALVYQVLDHTRTIMWMLGDGIVPSNSGEGYLARLVIRRAIRALEKLGYPVSLKALVKLQLEYWNEEYPRAWRARDYILEAVELEEERYKETLERGRKLVERILKRRKRLSLDDLIELYDSHGIPPDVVREIATKYNITIEIPHNFYALVASRHSKPVKVREGERARLPDEIVEWAKGFPPTRRLFHEDPFLKEFEAKVLGTKEKYLILDQTAFYPLGGGQINDTGKIISDNKEFKVVDVQKVGDVIVHVLDKSYDGGERVKGVVDWIRRYRAMRHHTATHILLGAARRLLGDHVWQAGAEKTPEKGRLDITHHKPLSDEEVKKLEEMVNKVIDERRKIKTMTLPKNEAESRYWFTIYQGGVPMDREVRLVEIEGWDVQACFGTHLTNTGEVGGFKIVNVSKIQDGVIRLEYVAGTRVAEEYSKLEEEVKNVARGLKADLKTFSKRIKSFIKEAEENKKLLNEYRKILVEELLKSARREDGLLIVEVNVDDRELIQEILRRGSERALTVVLANKRVEIAAPKDFKGDVGSIVKKYCKGGGKRTRATAICDEGSLKKLLDELKGL